MHKLDLAQISIDELLQRGVAAIYDERCAMLRITDCRNEMCRQMVSLQEKGYQKKVLPRDAIDLIIAINYRGEEAEKLLEIAAAQHINAAAWQRIRELAAKAKDDIGYSHWVEKAVILGAIVGEFATRNYGMMRRTAKKYASRMTPTEDLIGEFILAIPEIIEKCDPSRNATVLTYMVVFWSGLAMAKLSVESPVKISRKSAYLRDTFKEFRDDFIHENGRAPSMYEASVALNFSETRIAECIPVAISLDYEDPDNGIFAPTIAHIDPEFERFDAASAAHRIAAIINGMPTEHGGAILLRLPHLVEPDASGQPRRELDAFERRKSYLASEVVAAARKTSDGSPS